VANRKDIRAVRNVLYEKDRLRQMIDEARSIDVLMNLDPNGRLEPDDIRVKAGAGPLWFSESGALDPGVIEAADRCKRLAQLLLDVRRDIGPLKIPTRDKRDLRDALESQSRAWIARAKVWRDPAAPRVERDLGSIVEHERAAARSYKRVAKYLDERSVGGAI
jgi:hypothetical protein